MSGDESDNFIMGGDGNDALIGAAGNDTLSGGDGNDTLDGGDGDDALAGGKGDDRLMGGAGNDTYFFNQGDGTDSIADFDWDTHAIDTLRLGSGLTVKGTKLDRRGDHLILSWGNDSITIEGYFRPTYGRYSYIEKIVFSDGTTWSYTDIATNITQTGTAANDDWTGFSDQGNRMYGMAGNDVLQGGQVADVLDGGDGNDALIGAAGNDTLSGGNGNDTLDGGDGDDALAGGKGDDRLMGGAGNDTYFFNQGDGTDSIADFDWNTHAIDTLRLGCGLTVKGTKLDRRGDHLILSWGSDSITIEGYFRPTYGRYSCIEKIVFADGTTWSYTDIATNITQTGTAANDDWTGFSDQGNRMYGMAGNDVLQGGQVADVLDGGDGNDALIGAAGNDTLSGGNGNDTLDGGDGDDALAGGKGDDRLMGGAGNDTYFFNQGDGTDSIADFDWDTHAIDTLRLGRGLTVKETKLDRRGDHLILSWGSDSITIEGYFRPTYGRYSYIEKIVFADGTTWSYTDIASNITQTGTAANDDWTGFSDQGNRMYGMGGNDYLYGGQLADTIDGGDGDDTLFGGAGNDKLTGGDGNDTLDGSHGNDSLTGGKGNDRLMGGMGNDTYLVNQGDGIDTINDYDDISGNTDLLRFGSGITSDRLWFRHVGNNLEISVIGTSDKTIIENWYSGGAHQIERISTSDMLTLVSTDVDRLVQAMSSLGAPSSGMTVLPPAQRAALAPVLASSWH